ncbi:hypothetical protein [Clostridium fungisolvens]|uniref:Uncharacterized protein n=1 Tax=Clostridium fungisolvens TaxID=1604897 RepID=A0A6V8SIH2_9CLOT|nr:hypothetical protein [Clostridium fungisolvens]GFP76561.1 hypothetical protein bsdtw1_02664 [Clostridium fungisolvens]
MFQFFALLGFFLFFFSIISLVLYIFMAYALYKMAVRQGLENPWVAWIPIAQLYILGKLIKGLKIFDYEVPNIEIVLPVASIIFVVFRHVHILGTLVSLVNFILVLFALNKLYKLYKPENATFYTILSILGFTVPFIVFSLKDKDPIA